MAVSKAERLKRKRLSERERRKRMAADPKLVAEENRKRRVRYAKRLKKFKDEGRKVSEREKKLRRRKWRLAKRKQAQRKKAEELASGKVLSDKESSRRESMRAVAKRRAANKRVKQYHLMLKYKNRAENCARRACKYRQRYYRIVRAQRTDANSPRSILNRDLKNLKVSHKVRRRLLFDKAVEADVRESYLEINSKEKRKAFTTILKLRYIKKYRFLSRSKPFFPFDHRSPVKKHFGVRRKKMVLVRNLVRVFFERDDISVLSPSKNDCITRNKVKKQKRFLKHSLKYLFQKFSEKNAFLISYAAFCKLKPFWIVTKRVGDRDTCMCVKHENVALLCQRLRQLKIVSSSNPDKIIEEEMVCSKMTLECLLRECVSCNEKFIYTNEWEDKSSYYDTWETKMEEGSDKKQHRRTVKTRISCPTNEIVTKFIDALPLYMLHLGYIKHQYTSIKQLKKELGPTDLLLHVDFAENYMCKYSREIQSVHFGGNRSQITIHTGVLYTHSKTEAFATVSEDLQHNPTAIFMHLLPILSEYTKTIENLHLLSDSPTTQYRNQFMFYLLIKKVVPLFENLKTMTHNYSEAGHGKGAPDGVGATLKRTCDRIVACDQDVSNFQQFYQHIQAAIKGIKVIAVKGTNAELENEIKKNAKPVKGKILSSTENFQYCLDTVVKFLFLFNVLQEL
jgi:hypothetical protein